MSTVLEGDHLERALTPEPIAGPAMGSFVLHGALIGALVFYTVLGGLFHHNLWGNQGSGGAMQVTLVSNALPLPNNQPLNQNVLTTEKPSQAPEAPSPKEQKQVDRTAIPILGKQVKPQEKTTPKTQQHQPQPKQDNLARYGEQTGTVIPRMTQPQSGSNGPTAVRMVCGPDQQQDGEQLVQAKCRSTHAEGSARLSDLHDSQGWKPIEYPTGPVEREPDTGPLVPARRAARGHFRLAALGLQSEHAKGLLLL